LALPTDSSETFIREVEENYRRDRARDFFKTYGKWVIAGIVLFLGIVAGLIYWEEHSRKQSAEESVEMQKIFTDIGQGKTQTVPQRLQALEKSGADATRATAMLAEAAVALEKNDRSTALGKYRAMSDDSGLPDAYRNLATLRATALEFDTLKPEQVISRLEPLAKAGNPWFGTAGEMTALALLKQGKKPQAGAVFAAVAADKQVPGSIRSRAVQMAGSLGVDASASIPALEQQD
jgi:hypothetical protein